LRGLLRDIWFVLKLRTRLIGIKKTLFVIVVKTNKLNTMDIERLEMREKLLMVTLADIEFVILS
jgi:hypothetical protein